MIITNIFSIFDPSTSIFYTAWLIIILPIQAISAILWNPESPTHNILNNTISIINNEVSYSLNTSQNSVESIIITVFITILTLNFIALYPQIFSVTSHLAVTLPISLIFWFSIIIFAWTNNTNHILAHLLPQSTPPLLIVFMVLIEIVSNLIRPITLCVRLTANLIAGHLLISLLGTFLTSIPITTTSCLLLLPLILSILESAVACIQAYVFITLITLYITETK